MNRGQRVYVCSLSDPMSRLTLLFVEERDSLSESNRKIVVVHVKEWGRNITLWKEDIQESNPLRENAD